MTWCTFTTHFFTCARCPAVTVTLEAGGADTYTQRGHPRTLSGAIPGSEPSQGSCTFRLHADRPPEAETRSGQQACPQPMRGAYVLPWQASREYPDAREQASWRSIVRRTGEITRIRYEEVSLL